MAAKKSKKPAKNSNDPSPLDFFYLGFSVAKLVFRVDEQESCPRDTFRPMFDLLRQIAEMEMTLVDTPEEFAVDATRLRVEAARKLGVAVPPAFTPAGCRGFLRLRREIEATAATAVIAEFLTMGD
jgi:hypothetical protein